ncbi:ATP-grasp fold protein [Natronomonas pharaonis DSM 2160]|uniref:ATP-grasp fold protein n=1 Tax=Natronomonas pharaonis (strain ATCC 35678 / DSM 2160 / CIP 103997 / JCM 8858 / NBRC 14720 / NCIMB 2260 / Gabara) TaxID=348780 RepID=A0A1U7EVK8_NATPD|nr:PEP/pyruvate-binding domain-containing protein [Natronomonas pharaonis]CAI49065.1 ATP-grasp fold protein [Natronomonas pharaonis DSM 2160]
MTRPFVVILGAGRPFSGTVPSALQRISGDRRVLDWLIDAFSTTLENPEIHFVGGYRMDEIVEEYPDIHFSRNEDWEETGTIGSLLSAPLDETRPTYVCYADVVFQPEIVADLQSTAADAAVAIDERWRTRYRSRSEASRERAEKARYETADEPYVDRVASDLDPEEADAEFTGLTRLSPAAMRFVSDLVDRSLIGPEDDLADLVTALSVGEIHPEPVDVAGHWAELETAEDLARFVLDTKANTLKRLESMVTESTIAPQYTFTVDDFEDDPTTVADTIEATFDRPVIVRSSTLAEDGWEHSNAGRFESVLDVPPDDETALRNAIEAVIDSYDGNPHNQVLVQPMVPDVAASGVVMTRSVEHASPYYVINYDAETGSTVTVTDGSGDDIRTIIVRKDTADRSTANEPATGESIADRSVASTGDPALCLPALLRAVAELEEVVGHDGLDVEFAVTDDGEVYILQVRPMTVDPGEQTVDDGAVVRAIEEARDTFESRQSASPFVFGDRAIYGVMPDWNPAEIIGRTPRLLADSLYRYLIMDEVWARQRAEFGYRDVRPHPLMFSFAGQPYVDVRADFNSFIPAAVSDELAEKLVDHYLTRLEENPELHDKIEFEIAVTCLPFDFEHRAEPLREAGFTDAELDELREGLRGITQGAFERVEGGVDMAKVDDLERRYERLRTADIPDLQLVRTLLEDCRRLGTLPFAHLARAAFVAVSLLRSLERKGILTDEQVSEFLNSLETVAREFEHDGYLVAQGELGFEEYVERYGHLRPGTYDITSPRYAADPEGYLRPTVETASEPDSHPRPDAIWDGETAAEIEAELESIGLPADIDRFVDFLRDSIKGREYAKFIFSKNLSLALERLAAYGQEHDLDRDTLSHVSIEDVLELTTGHPPQEPAEWLHERAAEGQRRHTIAQAVELPPLLTEEREFDRFERPAREPNFVTTETVREQIAEPDEDDDPTLDGRIVLIPQADPGYDWLFGYDIAGLVTMYGGTNSHMAIRAAEFGLPAAIGVGESLYEQLSGAEVIELDCEAKAVERIR